MHLLHSGFRDLFNLGVKLNLHLTILFLHVTYGLYMVIGWNQIQRKTAEAVGDFRKTPIYIVGMILKNNLPL
jgi:hypothetical protein